MANEKKEDKEEEEEKIEQRKWIQVDRFQFKEKRQTQRTDSKRQTPNSTILLIYPINPCTDTQMI